MKAASARATLLTHGPVASVRSSWTDWDIAHVPVVNICDLHWDEMPGHRSSEVVLCGFTSSRAIIAGQLSHVDADPRNLRVCILPEDNDRGVFARLALEAGPRPRKTNTAA